MPAPDFKVVFWVDRTGLRHQVYDVRKGQYTQAVDDWVNRLEFDASGFVLPGNLATVRDVRIEAGSGRPESEQLAAAIEKEERRLLGRGLDQRLLRAPSLSSGSEATLHRLPSSSPGMLGRSPGANRVQLGPQNPPFPVPYPYPRPHP